MADIAEGAGISRPALYQHFANKDAIFRALVEEFVEELLSDALAVLRGELPLEQRLTSAFDAWTGAILETVGSPLHGEELLDANSRLAADAWKAGTDQLLAATAAALREQEDPNAAALTSEDAARLLKATADGLKYAAVSRDEFRYRLGQQVRVLLRAID